MKKLKILIADDSEFNRAILYDLLSTDYDILEAKDGEEAIFMLNNHNLEISLVLLDIIMPKADGFDVLNVMKNNGWIDSIPVIIISSETSPAALNKAFELGATDYINRPFDFRVVTKRIANSIMLYAKQRKLIDMIAEQVYEKELNNNLMIQILSNIVEFRNGESGLHIIHVHNLTEILLNELIKSTDKYKLSENDIAMIVTASALHDIGKISIDEKILNKPGKLTKEEFEIMKTHTVIGAEMLSKLEDYKNQPLIQIAHDICRWHHEKYDGRGYPDGLVGDQIPISAQVVALVDVYDALTSKRVYKDAFTHEQAIEMIKNGECGAFNPILLETFFRVSDKLKDETLRNKLDTINYNHIATSLASSIHNNPVSYNQKSIQMLEEEKSKTEFFASISKETQFEYSLPLRLINFSNAGKELGLPEFIINPAENIEFTKVIKKSDVARFLKAFRESTPENPFFNIKTKLNVKGTEKWHTISARSLWSKDEHPVLTGFIGKIIDIHETETKLLRLTDLSQTDSLTGLLNHKAAKRRIEELLKEKSNEDYAMIIIDLDDFKLINDNNGHWFGDEVLKYIAKVIKGCIKRKDVASRVGGDEFLIFTNKENCDNIIDTLRAVEFDDNGVELKQSISIGYTFKNHKQDKSYYQLFTEADKALYYAKKNSKGLPYCYSQELARMFSSLSNIED